MRCVLVHVGAVLALTGCGSRTGLLVPLEEAPAPDAGGPVGAPDASFPPDAMFPLDAAPGALIRVLVPEQAPEGIYQYGLGEFDPATGTFSEPQTIPMCVAAVADRPISLASACDGTAYIQFAQGSLWVIDAATLDCRAAPLDLAAIDLSSAPTLAFGIDAQRTEHLYFVGPSATLAPAAFGVLDRSTLTATSIYRFSFGPVLHMSGDATGRLYATDPRSFPGTIVWFPDATGDATPYAATPAGATSSAPFAYWSGAFYFFEVQPSGTTNVVAWSPGSAPVMAAQTARLIVAAGSSPCGPH